MNVYSHEGRWASPEQLSEKNTRIRIIKRFIFDHANIVEIGDRCAPNRVSCRTQIFIFWKYLARR
jgi:hypothetical protein